MRAARVRKWLGLHFVEAMATQMPNSTTRDTTGQKRKSPDLWAPARLMCKKKKRAVTAYYKGTQKGGEPALLRSYDSRKESAPEYDCKIWEAGRATSAVGLAFKPIRVGQSLFHDDGGGTFNPSPAALDEATVNEWPGRDVGVFVSIGTGRRPRGTETDSHVWYEGFMGEYADARKKLIAKIEQCEAIHEYMVKQHLLKRGVNVENYYRLNVEVGVGEFGMNEWHRLSDISTGTRRYLSRSDEQKVIQGSSTKLAKIYRAMQRHERLSNVPDMISPPPATYTSMDYPLAVELPGDYPLALPVQMTPSDRQSYDSGIDRLSLPGSNPGFLPSPRSSNERTRPATSHASSPPSQPSALHKPSSQSPLVSATRPPPDDPDRLVVTAPTPEQYRHGSGADKIMITSPDEHSRRSVAQPLPQQAFRIEPLGPPVPPKTPLQDKKAPGHRRPPGGSAPPYPMEDDAPPPVVNMAKKPNYRAR